MTASEPAGEHVLVTGGTGFVGGWCVLRLLERSYRVRATVRTPARADAVRRAVTSRLGADPGDRLDFAIADLEHDAGWAEATAGIDLVLHVASPLSSAGSSNPSNPEDLIRPAVDGTLRVLRAAREAGVRRIVVTSSGAAATPTATTTADAAVLIDEDHWTDPAEPGLTAYRASKTLAERAAWDFVATQPGMELATVLPGAILGPTLPGLSASSTEVVTRMLRGRMPAIPRIELGVVDVRDLAELHLLALTGPDAAGKRFLAIAEICSMADIAAILRAGLGQRARRVPRRIMPDLVLRLLARFDHSVDALVPMLGRRISAESRHARNLLDWRPRPLRDTVLDTAAAA